MYVSTLEFAGNGPKGGNGPRCVLCVQNARQTPVQNGVLALEKTAATFFAFLCTKMAAPFYTHTEVCYAGHKMTF